VVGGNVSVKDVETGQAFWSRQVRGVRRLEWSRDGELLLVQGGRSLRVFDAAGRLRFELLRPPAAPVVAAAFAPSGHAVAFVQHAGERSDLWLVPQLRPDASRARRLFVGAGRFTDLAWSPDGRWLLVNWPTADQWVFVSAGGQRIRAAANVAAQFRSRTFPRVEGWCCAR
jgi:dipeptidyl aminopeptidase/acylaminoacyl peptidase